MSAIIGCEDCVRWQRDLKDALAREVMQQRIIDELRLREEALRHELSDKVAALAASRERERAYYDELRLLRPAEY